MLIPFSRGWAARARQAKGIAAAMLSGRNEFAMRFDLARPLIGLALCAALAGCGEKAADNGSSRTSNEVLQGSTSDAMIAFDELRSQGQQADPAAAETDAADGTPRRANGSSARTPEGAAGVQDGAEAEAEPAPAAEPVAPAGDDEG